MESVECIGSSSKKDIGDVESEAKAAASAEVADGTNLEKCSGIDECSVMAIDRNDAEEPQKEVVIAPDSLPEVVKIESIAKDNVSEMGRTCDTDAASITIAVECDIEVPTGDLEAGDVNAMQQVKTVTPTVVVNRQEGEAIDTDADENTTVEPNTIEISNGKSATTKLNDVTVPKAVGSLGLLVQYDSSSEDDESDNANKDNLKTQAKDLLEQVMANGEYRVADDDDGDSDETETEDDDSDVECVGEGTAETIDITNDEDLKAFMDSCDDTPKGPIKSKGEFGLDDLPPIADLTITVPESECIQLGTISAVVGTLVLVESLPNFAAVDIDTVLFLDKGNRTLGQVFDVMGNVASPIYCVRFNKAQDIVDKLIEIGSIVYVAPKTEHTSFIVLSELMNQKGTDASWEDDIEPPNGCDDFSDDDEERTARRVRNQQQRNRNRTSISSDTGDVQLPIKVTVKQEPITGIQRGRNRRNNNNNRINRNQDNAGSRQFYKDNRDYANTAPHYPNFYQNRQPMQFDHSWHTAGMIPSPMPSASNAIPPGMQMPMPQGCYPNPFAMASNHPMNYGYFNMQAFPPLPPPMDIPPQSSQSHSQRNRHFNNNTFNKRHGPHSDNQ